MIVKLNVKLEDIRMCTESFQKPILLIVILGMIGKHDYEALYKLVGMILKFESIPFSFCLAVLY
jgi:hypothetical protein